MPHPNAPPPRLSWPGLLWACLGGALLAWNLIAFNGRLSPEYGAQWPAAIALVGLSWLACAGAVWAFPRQPGCAVWGVQAVGSAMVLADTLYWRYFGEVMPVGALFHGGHAMGVHRSVASLVGPGDGWLLAATPACLLLAIAWPWLAKAAVAWGWPKSLGWGAEGAGWAHMGLAFVSCFGIAWVLHDFEARHPKALSGAWNPPYLAASIGTPVYHLVDAAFTLGSLLPEAEEGKPERVADELAADDARTGPIPGEGVARGKSLIVVQVEALQAFTVGLKVQGREVTPHLNALTQRSLYFPQVYAQVKEGNTSDAEFMANTALYPAPRGAAFVRFAHNRYSALPKALAAQGYRTMAFHANAPGFWNRATMYEALGFQHFVSAVDYEPTELLGLGLSDKAFFAQNLKRLAGVKRPFYAWMVTLSSHHPYDEAAQVSGFPLPTELEGTMLGHYLQSIHYADAQLGGLIAGMKAQGLWEDCVLAIVGDHPGVLREDRAALLALLGEPNEDVAWRKQQRVPFIVHLPDEAVAGTHPLPGGQIDLWPTLAHLMGLERPLAFGQNLLLARSPFVVFPDGACLAGDAFHEAPELAQGQASGDQVAALSPELQLARHQLASSATILRRNWQPQLEAKRRKQHPKAAHP